MTDIPLPRRPDKVPWWQRLFGLNTDQSEELTFAGGRTTADTHVEKPPGDQTIIDEDIGLAIKGTVPRPRDFSHT